VSRHLRAAKTSPVLPLRVRRTFIDELRPIIERWAFGRELHGRAATSRKQIAHDQAIYLGHLNAIRHAITAGQLSRRWLMHLDRLEAELSIARRWELANRLTLRRKPSEKHIRDALRAVLKRHHVDATTAARAIHHWILPELPEEGQAALRGPSREKAEQIRHIAEWLRRSR
jgi:hypothetical protein